MHSSFFCVIICIWGVYMNYSDLRGLGFTLNKEILDKFEKICDSKKSTVRQEVINFIETEVQKYGNK